MKLKEKVIRNLNENVFHSIGDKMDNGGGSFLKGLLAGGIGLAAFSDPETAHHVKEAISGTAHNLGNILGISNEHASTISDFGNNMNHETNVIPNTAENNNFRSIFNNNPNNLLKMREQIDQIIDKQHEAWNNAYSDLNPTQSALETGAKYLGYGTGSILAGVLGAKAAQTFYKGLKNNEKK